MSSMPLFDQTPLAESLASLKNDLIQDDGPHISTMRNYRFAILQYKPEDEFELRRKVQQLSRELEQVGWVVLTISLQKLLYSRLREQKDDWLARIMNREREFRTIDPERGLNDLKKNIGPLIEGPDGISADCAKIISEFADANPDKIDRTVALVGRAGSLFPFFRSSALLKHLDGKTRQVPVILLYPGERRGQTSLSFMGELNSDSDYRPRIY
jgi:Domain of unknown function (DUF1788)